LICSPHLTKHTGRKIDHDRGPVILRHRHRLIGTDDEQRSAALGKKMLAGVPRQSATPTGAVDRGPRNIIWLRIFLDMDLSILGGDAVALDHQEAGMRQEHHHVPEALFPAGASGHP
jgi:predicted metal-dependent HD superfamily phosphohydrolase